MKNADLSLKSLKPALAGLVRSTRKFAAVLIFLLFTAIYGYTIVQINSLSNPAVDQSTVTSESKALPTPRMDEAAAAKLQSLEDNSVNVQSLFDKSRTDPFSD